MTMRPPFFIFTAGLTFPKAGYSVEVGPLEASMFFAGKKESKDQWRSGLAWVIDFEYLETLPERQN